MPATLTRRHFLHLHENRPIRKLLARLANHLYRFERLQETNNCLRKHVPFFLHGGLARCRGIGERVEPLESPGSRRFLLLLPDLAVATKRIFEALEPGLPEKPRAATIFLEKYRGTEPGAGAPFFNRLAAAAERVVPRLRMIRENADRAGSAGARTASRLTRP